MNKLRKTLMENLEQIFNTAGKIVKGQTKHQRINGKLARALFLVYAKMEGAL